MSLHLHTAIGYAMPYGDFLKATSLIIDKNEFIGDELSRLLEPYRKLRYGGEGSLWRFLDDGMITKGNPESLVAYVGSGDDLNHIMFFPNEALKNKWQRFNDDLDWAFAQRGPGDIASVEEYLNEGFTPFRDEFPEPLRFWITHCGVLPDPTVLRPMRACWWG